MIYVRNLQNTHVTQFNQISNPLQFSHPRPATSYELHTTPPPPHPSYPTTPTHIHKVQLQYQSAYEYDVGKNDQTSKYCWKRCVFRFDLKEKMEGEWRNSLGREFQNWGPKCETIYIITVFIWR